MLIDLSREVGSYLHNVFVVKLTWLVLVGYVGQALFTMRFVVQWIATERARRASFRSRSGSSRSAAGCCCSSMRCSIKDPVFILGQGFGVFVYLRNLYFVYRERNEAKVASTASGLGA